ncbi:hypothetical protein AGLY_016755 [Aphis glycines]|uniref:Uncharacterized protein n=1 Tax=Aphis glycines TaxID=307491 RepID=A0A6G0SYW0_APHGL|nr:hypothetical protein AGLY_016755 [Aphis glycines]
MKTVGNCSLLTVISIKDIRFAVENHPQSYKHQGHSVCSRKPPSKFVIGAFFRQICRFRSFFFFVYVIYYENCWEMFTFNGYKHQGHSICSRKPPSKLVIGAFFRLHQGHSICSRKPPSKFVIGAFLRLHQGHSICSRKPPSKFVIGAFFQLVMLYKETKKKFQKSINNSKNTYYFESSTIHR